MILTEITAAPRKSRLDRVFIFSVIGLVILGSLAVCSAVRSLPYYHQTLIKHFTALGAGAVLFWLATGLTYEFYEDQSPVIYGLVLASLIGVLLFGTVHRGHRSWISLGFFAFQPSEFARVGLILVLGAFLDRFSSRVRDFPAVLSACAIVFPAAFLMLKQPDLSMTITLFPILLGLLFCAGARWEYLTALIAFALLAALMPFLYIGIGLYNPHPRPMSLAYVVLALFHGKWPAFFLALGLSGLYGLVWFFGFLTRNRLGARALLLFWFVTVGGTLSGIVVGHRLRGYQRSRFASYVDPGSDLRGSAYHVRQSQIAIGSGGFFGKGFFSGTQSQLGFLPERHTDFIYSVVGEEAGFVGAAAVLALYLVMIWRIGAIGLIARDRYGYLVCSGVAAMFACDLFLNVGMCLGLLPVAGIPLPLVSYGGSSLLASLWSLGIVANIGRRRYALL